MKVRALLRSTFNFLVKFLGTKLIDERTGEEVAHAIVFCWRGRIYLIGYRGRDHVMPIFLPQEKMNYNLHTIGFTTHPAPDFPHEFPR
jgi:hypothetical protein